MIRSHPRCRHFLWIVLLHLALVLTAATRADAQPTFSKAFAPTTIAPGNVSTLTFTITTGGTPALDLAFTDVLPAGMTIATPANAATTCSEAVLGAPAGGTTISLSGGRLAANSTCTVTVDVTSSTVGTHTNTSGDLTSSAGNSGPATADLTVDAARPAFAKSFSPSVVPLGGNSTLTFTIDNTANGGLVFSLAFTDNLPSGLVVADPANVSNTCTGTVTANPGAGTISLVNGFINGALSCTISVDVNTTLAGSLGNTTGGLTSSVGTSGKASAVLDVDLGFLSKVFTNDPAVPGGTTTLSFTITNFDRTDTATDISFTDDLDAALSGLVATGLPQANVCGAGSQLSGTSTLSFTGGTLGPEASCTFQVTLQVPAGAAPGTYPNTTSLVTATLGGDGVTRAAASDNLVVVAAPVLTKTFTDDPAVAGGDVTLEFTITNTSTTASATGITFADQLDTWLAGITSTRPANGFCGGGSSITQANDVPAFGISDVQSLYVQNASLAAGASCTFQVTLHLPAGAPDGSFTNTTTAIRATVDGVAVSGNAASDDLVIAAGPTLTKAFTDAPVVPGGTVTLEYTLAYDEDAAAGATGIAFTDDLDAALSGLVATGLPANDVCGAGSQLSGTSTLSFTGGSLAAGASCTFQVTLQVPAGALPGNFTSTTSDVTATVLGTAVTTAPATAVLEVSGMTFSKSFTDDPVAAGGSVTLSFTIRNQSPVSAATGIAFTDDLDAALSGLVATGLPANDVCGAGSQLSGTSTLSFTGGSLAAGASCTFQVTLDVPTAAAGGEYANTTSNLTASVGGEPVTIGPASDNLLVQAPLVLTKSFTDDPVAPGGTVTLAFTITNDNATAGATDISFTDDLDAALSGLVATGLPANDVCGAGSQLSGTSTLSFTGGSLAAGASCTFQVTLQVPAGIPQGTTVTNTTSAITATIGGIGVSGGAASDDLELLFFSFSTAFDGPTVAGGTATLSVTIQNQTGSTASNIGFTDDLDAVLSGLVATGLPQANVCGAGSQLSGASTVVLTGGTLAAGASCSFSFTVQVPGGAAEGVYTNTTSGLLVEGLTVTAPATSTLTVAPVNDPIASATRLLDVDLVDEVGFSAASVTPGVGDACFDAASDRDVWYVLKAAENGDVTVDIGTPTDVSTVLFYTAANTSATQYSDLTLVSTCGLHDPETQTVTAGQPYYVRVINRNNAGAGVDSEVTFSGTVALPVELAAFDAALDGNAVMLRWETASETNNAGFEVQHRAGAAPAWDVLGFVAGAGTTVLPQAYHYRTADLGPGGHAFRLKQVDYDGTFAYGPEVEVVVEVPHLLVLAPNYPNPFNPQTEITFTVPSEGRATLKVYNLQGQEVETLFDAVAQPGRVYRNTFDAGSLASGLYLYQLRFGGRRLHHTMLLAK